jgi:YVTN family beta-propeller protein
MLQLKTSITRTIFYVKSLSSSFSSSLLLVIFGLTFILSGLFVAGVAGIAKADSVISTIPVGTHPQGIAFDSANGNVYVANAFSNSISVISGSTNQVIATIPLSMQPRYIVFDSVNGNMYVAGVIVDVSPTGQVSDTLTLAVISSSTNQVIANVPIAGGSRQVGDIGGIAFDPANGNLYVTSILTDTAANVNLDRVSVISTATNQVIATINISGPGAVAFDPANDKVYVASGRSNSLFVIDPATNQAIAIIHLAVTDIAFDPANGNLYTTGSNGVSVISSSTNQVISTIPIANPDRRGIAYNSANGNMYVTNNADNSVSVISTATNQVIDTIPVGTHPQGIAFDSSNGNMYVANTDSNSVSVISTANTLKHATTLLTNPISSVTWNKAITVTGKLTDSNNNNAGVAGKTITFTGTGASNLAAVTTNTDGTFTASGTAPNTVANGWTVKATFAGDNNFLASTSATISYNTYIHTTALTLNPIASTVRWSSTVTVTGKLTDSNNNNAGVAGKTITFNGTGASNLAAVTTNTDGTFTASGTAPSTVANGWKVQAHFAAGDNLYSGKDSTIITYNTLKHATTLTISISPTSVSAGATYSVSGLLSDATASAPLTSRTITFTSNSSAITISPRTTDSTGHYSATGLKAPRTAGTYSIQAHFAGTSLYNAVNSVIRTLKVTSTTAATTTTTTTTTATALSSPTTTATPTKTVTSTPPPTISTTIPSYPSSNQLSTSPLTAPSTTKTTTAATASSNNTHTERQQPLQLQQQPRLLSLQPQQQPLPIANAGISRTVAENTLVMLDGRASYSPSNSDGNSVIGGARNSNTIIVAYQWTQLPMGVPIVLSNANTATPTFMAPIVSKDTTLAFSLRVMDNHGMVSTNTAIVYITVKHNQQQIQQQPLQQQQLQQGQQSFLQQFPPFFITPSQIR